MATYVMSDIHGQYDLYIRMMETIGYHSQTDKLYIIGDVIDRGPDGVALLRDCMNRRGVTLLLGNHEDILLHVLHAKRTGSKEDLWQKIWTQNGGDITREDFFSRPAFMQENLENFLLSCPLQLSLTVNGRRFLMAHACPLNMSQEEYDRHRLAMQKNYTVRIPPYRNFLLWQRVEKGDVFPKNATMLFGHTPTCFYQDNAPFSFWKEDNLIGLDCGLAGLPRGNKNARLGCLRLDDMEEWYISP